jgi:hypothetical protein
MHRTVAAGGANELDGVLCLPRGGSLPSGRFAEVFLRRPLSAGVLLHAMTAMCESFSAVSSKMPHTLSNLLCPATASVFLSATIIASTRCCKILLANRQVNDHECCRLLICVCLVGEEDQAAAVEEVPGQPQARHRAGRHDTALGS